MTKREVEDKLVKEKEKKEERICKTGENLNERKSVQRKKIRIEEKACGRGRKKR
jgi:hypothetical protein